MSTETTYAARHQDAVNEWERTLAPEDNIWDLIVDLDGFVRDGEGEEDNDTIAFLDGSHLIYQRSRQFDGPWVP